MKTTNPGLPEKEHWTRWTPHVNIHNNYYLISTTDAIDKVVIHLAYVDNDDYEATLSFENKSVIGYRQVDEGSRLTLYSELNKTYGADFYASWPFFIVENSRYLAHILTHNSNPSLYNEYIHFSFFTTDHIIDVISKKHPETTLICNPLKE